MAEKCYNFVPSAMDLLVFTRGCRFPDVSSDDIVQDISGRESFATDCINPLERRKRPFSEVTQGSNRDPEISSPERKRRRIIMDTGERGTETPSTSRQTPFTVAKVVSLKRKKTYTKKCRQVTAKAATVWIIGDSYVQRGEEAAQEKFGRNFGLNANVLWFGKGGMRWTGVLPRFYAELATQSPPDILVIHAGGNDLGLTPSKQLVSVLQRDLMQLHAEFPSMTIAFSCINERQVWRAGRPGVVNHHRKTVNQCVRRNIGSLGGEVVEHPLLRYYKKRLYLPDGVHFTRDGNQVFLSSIQCTLRKILQKSPFSIVVQCL